jgi:hypothetical protein
MVRHNEKLKAQQNIAEALGELTATPGERDVFDRPTLPFLGTKSIPETFRGLSSLEEIGRIETLARPAFEEQKRVEDQSLGPGLFTRTAGAALKPFVTPIDTFTRKDMSVLDRLTVPVDSFMQAVALGYEEAAKSILGMEPSDRGRFRGKSIQEIQQQLSDEFGEKPWWEQLALSILDPFALVGLIAGSSRATKTLSRIVADAADNIPEGFARGQQFKVVKPTELQENVIGLRPIEAGLTKTQQVDNTVRSTFGLTPLHDDIANAAMLERNRVIPAIENTASTLGFKHDFVISQAFEIDKAGRISSLAGIDPLIPGAPTIQDIAARLPNYKNSLSPEQLSALEGLRDALRPYRELFDEVGGTVGSRSDVMDGGFYIPRGRSGIEGVNAPTKIRGNNVRVGGKSGYAKPEFYESQAAGIEAGREYASLREVLTTYVKSIAKDSVDLHVANYFKTAIDPVTGKLLGETVKMRMFRQNPGLVIEMDGLRRQWNRLKALSGRIDDRTARVVDDFLNSSEFMDIDDLLDALDIKAMGGPNAGFNRVDVKDALAEVRKQIQDLGPEWRAARRRAAVEPSDQHVIDLPGLQEVTFPDEIANAANRFLKEGGVIDYLNKGIKPFNDLYRGMRATGEFSGAGIQGLVGLANDPEGYGAAMRAMFSGVWDEQTLGRFLVDYDRNAAAAGRITSDVAAKMGVRVGGGATEFQLGTGFISKVGDLPVIKQANRSFGFFGDVLRLEWFDMLVAEQLAKGRAMPELLASGDLQKMAKVVNNMTGWSEAKAFGSVGDLLLFAPRFLQSRLQTIGNAALGMRPGANLEQRIARKSVLQMIGWGTALTYAVNGMLGNETDTRLIVDGRPNPNFMRIRAGGRDWSIFGTWDSLLKVFVSLGISAKYVAEGNPEEATDQLGGIIRGMGSGGVQNVWNLVSGAGFTGEEVPDIFEDPAGFGIYIFQENLVPFAYEEIGNIGQQIAEGDVVGGGAALMGEAFGVKSSPISPSEKRDIARQQVMDEMRRGLEPEEAAALGLEFDNLTDTQRHEIDADQRVIDAMGVLIESRQRRGSPYQGYLTSLSDLDSAFKKDVDSLNSRMTSTREGMLKPEEAAVFGREFREQLGILQRDLSRDKDKLREDSSEALEFFDELEPRQGRENEATQKYFKLVFDPNLEDTISGTYDFLERERRIEDLRKEYGDEMVDRIEVDLKRNEHPVIRRLRLDREKITESGYFDITNTMIDGLGLRDLYNEYLAEDLPQRRFILATTRMAPLKDALDALDSPRGWGPAGDLSLRQAFLSATDPEIDRLLLKWGYRPNPSHPVVKKEVEDRATTRELQRQSEHSWSRPRGSTP